MKYSIGALGLGVTFIIFLSLRRQRQIIDDLRKILKERDRAYYIWRQEREAADKNRFIKHGQDLIFLGLPLVFGLFWIIVILLEVTH